MGSRWVACSKTGGGGGGAHLQGCFVEGGDVLRDVRREAALAPLLRRGAGGAEQGDPHVIGQRRPTFCGCSCVLERRAKYAAGLDLLRAIWARGKGVDRPIFDHGAR